MARVSTYVGSQVCCGCAVGWMLVYKVKLIKFEEPPEERIESSHFTPPLSKQRNDFARTLINALEAKFLVMRIDQSNQYL